MIVTRILYLAGVAVPRRALAATLRSARAVAGAGVLGPTDGMHIFTYGSDITALVATIHALHYDRARGENEAGTAEG